MNYYNSNNQHRHKFGYLDMPKKKLYQAQQQIKHIERSNDRELLKQMERWEEKRWLFEELPMANSSED